MENGTGAGTMQIDNVQMRIGTTAGGGWMSGRDVVNHFDDDGQAHINYVDVYDIPGDVPALAQIRATENEAHTDFWMGARHGTRQIDGSIFLEGESFAGSGGLAYNPVSIGDASNGTVGSMDSSVASPGAPEIVTLALPTPPRGNYRVLMRTRTGSAATPTATSHWGAGYSYGSIIQTPNSTSDYVSFGTSTVFGIVDVGGLTIPPTDLPEGGTLGTYTLRIAHHGTNNPDPDIDWVQLMPVDQGMVFVSKTSAVDRLLVDSRSKLKTVYITNTLDVLQQIPGNQQGLPPELEPRGSAGTSGSRFYFAFDDTATASIGHGVAVHITYVPRYLHVA
jgi:hypothetical protein